MHRLKYETSQLQCFLLRLRGTSEPATFRSNVTSFLAAWTRRRRARVPGKRATLPTISVQAVHEKYNIFGRGQLLECLCT